MGDVLYLLGANGTGKSSLVSHWFNAHANTAKRISAHRQTWIQSNALNLTASKRESLEQQIRSQDQQTHARYRLEYANERAGVAIYDLVDADNVLSRKITELLRSGKTRQAQEEAKKPAPLQEINELMRLSNIPIKISLEERQKVVAQKSGGVGYSVAELSDGERNAFLIAADVLTAKPGTLLLIDEPERHLHRAIISPLLRLLFKKRSDCAFVVSTHEVMLPLDTPFAATLLLRSCHYTGERVAWWSADLLESGTAIDEELKRDLLGSRRKMLFVEGTASSLDLPLYSLLLPEVSVIPKESCRDVEQAVQGLHAAKGVHWIASWGIVDNDQRDAEDVERLEKAGILALQHYSIESLYYHPKVVARIAQRQVDVLGGDAESLVKSAIASAINAAKNQKDHLVGGTVLRTARSQVLSSLPNRTNKLAEGATIKVEVDVDAIRSHEEAAFDSMVAAEDWEGLLTRYPLRESPAFGRLVDGLKIKDRAAYQDAVLKLLQDDAEALTEVRQLLGDIYEKVSA